MALALHHRTQAPVAMCAQSALAAATLAVQAQRNVELPGGGCKPLTGFHVTIADSGERKSSVDRIALAPVLRVEEEWRQDSERDRLSYINAKAAWDTGRDRARRTKGDVATIRAALDAVGPEPKAPPHPMLLVADPTPEALTLHLALGRPMAGVFTAEGGLLIGGAAFNDEAKMRTAALFNTLWDGDAIRRLRVGTGEMFLPGRRCSAHLMLQPIVAEALLADPLFEGIGFLARTLIAAPSSTAGTRLYREPNGGDDAILADYNARLTHLLKRQFITRPDMPDALDPPVMRLHPEAKVAWIAFHDLCEQAIALNGGLSTVRPFGAKLAEHAGRLAAILTLYDNPDAMEVPLVAMQCGVTLATYYANEMLRLHGGASISRELRIAQRLLTWWQSQRDPILHLAMIYQFGPVELRDAKSARAATKILEESGWVQRLPPNTIVDGKAHKEVWRLVP
nr:YfjI family protein [Sphingomonas lutea]